jgi:PleD family two-component response regulator
MPATAIAEAEIVINRLLGAVPDGQTASAGIAQWSPGEDAATFVGRTDEALYRAKREGRDRSVRAPSPVIDPGPGDDVRGAGRTS